MPITIAGRPFASQKALKAFTKDIVHRLLGRTISEGPDFDFLVALFQFHATYGKLQDGVAVIGCVHNEYKVPTLMVTFNNGSVDNISYNDCITRARFGRWLGEQHARPGAMGELARWWTAIDGPTNVDSFDTCLTFLRDNTHPDRFAELEPVMHEAYSAHAAHQWSN